MRHSLRVRAVLTLAVVLLAACHGGSSPPTPPTIRDLVVEPRAVYASQAPTSFTVRWQFDDPNGDVAAATVTVTDAQATVVAQQTIDVRMQSLVGSLLTSAATVALPTVGSYTFTVELTDLAGHHSNALSQLLPSSPHPWQLISGHPYGLLIDVGLAATANDAYALGGVYGDPPGLPPLLRHIDSMAFVCAYRPTPEAWTFPPPLGAGRQGVAAVEWNGRIFSIGGWDYADVHLPGGTFRNVVVATVEQFDPGAGTWSPRAAMPTPRFRAAAVLLGSSIVVVGGESAPLTAVPLDAVAGYDPQNDTWTALPQMPRARSRPRAAAFAGRLWVAGGQNSALADETAVDVFDPVTGLWSTAAQTPGPATLLVELGGRLVAATATGLAANADPLVAPWQPLTQCPASIDFTASATVLGGKLYVLRRGELWRYDPALELR